MTARDPCLRGTPGRRLAQACQRSIHQNLRLIAVPLSQAMWKLSAGQAGGQKPGRHQVLLNPIEVGEFLSFYPTSLVARAPAQGRKCMFPTIWRDPLSSNSQSESPGRDPRPRNHSLLIPGKDCHRHCCKTVKLLAGCSTAHSLPTFPSPEHGQHEALTSPSS